MTKIGGRIRVLLVDDHAVLRSGMRYILDLIDKIQVVGEGANGLEAIELCAVTQPDIILMDIMMPEMDGIEATRILTRSNPNLRIIMLTSFSDEENVRSALEAGATSYLTKNIGAVELTEAVLNAYQNRPTISPEAVQSLLTTKVATLTPGSNLTNREIEVLGELAHGHSNPEIANVLMISRATVKRHVSNILTKLDVKSRTEAVALALKHRIVE